MIQNKTKALLILLLFSCNVHVWALEGDRNKPIEIEADQGSLDQKNQTTVFTGNVKMRQGSMYMNAGRITAHKDNAGNQTMVATGNLAKFGQQLEKDGMVTGQGNQINYDSLSGIVTVTGNAQVNRAGDMVQGTKIIYNTRTEVYTVHSDSKNRVHVLIQPQTKNK